MRLSILLSLTALPSLIAAQRRCYFPDGSRAPSHRACSQDAETDNSVHSSCCGLDDNVVCLSSKLCINQNGYIYRGACTDQTWEDEACPSSYCTSFAGSGMNILPCNDVTRQWCCAEGGTIPCCQNENRTKFLLNPGTVTYVAAGLSTVSLPASSSTSAESTSASDTSTTTTTSDLIATSAPQPTPTTLSTGVAVGMGIGIGIPTVLAIVFASLWLIERSKRKRQQQPIVPPAPFTSDYHHQSYGGGGRSPPELHDTPYSSELSSGYDRQPLQSADALELSARSVKPPGYTGGY
ncbi:uncharacterized protein DFL_005429 [Arthrobotrys flagrans]|uniref:Mid2 domain-containing protein n=1 Tax=Arthrobotrys flagrans TaxID=97331 RepID=A0A436ZXL0_ARTFL|nr:hypothetical protein DFL_005429 [Arthrobotrys flagrans]